MENLTVLVPFYNEENTIYESVTKLISSLKLEKIIGTIYGKWPINKKHIYKIIKNKTVTYKKIS